MARMTCVVREFHSHGTPQAYLPASKVGRKGEKTFTGDFRSISVGKGQYAQTAYLPNGDLTQGKHS